MSTTAINIERPEGSLERPEGSAEKSSEKDILNQLDDLTKMIDKINLEDDKNDVNEDVQANAAVVARPTMKPKPKGGVNSNIYSPCMLTRNITVPITAIGKDTKRNIENVLCSLIEGKCTVEGYVKPGSIEIKTYSSGLVRGTNVIFVVVFSCMVCYPVEGMNVLCIVKTVTKAGVTADIKGDAVSPMIVFIARDHHYSNPEFSKLKEGDEVLVRVIGQRFELNDKYISVIAEWMKQPAIVVRKG